MKNKHIEMVKKYLNDPKSVTIEELEANKRDANTAAFYADVDDNAYAAANAAANAYAAAHADATDAYAYTDDAAYEAAYYDAAYYDAYAYAYDAAANYVKQYEDLVK
tara:strand:+ start:222 stop:542 length:321 start_codon:yes stop_codon:yes gene_type:complete